jgi:flagellar biosynthesis GTPase FlhF
MQWALGLRALAATPTPERPAAAAGLVAAMTRRGLRTELAAELVDDVLVHRLPLDRSQSLHAAVVAELARRIPTRPLSGGGGHVVAFVGAGGSGKTRSIARLAAAYGTRGPLPVTAFTLRSDDRGGLLAALLGPVAIQVWPADDVERIVERLGVVREHALVLVDTPGVSPRNAGDVQRLGAELGRLSPDQVHLAVPATIAAESAAELVAGLRPLGLTHLTLTHADETERLGAVVQLALDAQLPIGYVAEGATIDSGLRPGDPLRLAQAVVGPVAG